MRILVDLDGVLVNTLPTWLTEYRSVCDDKIQEEHITSYDFGKIVKYPSLFFSVLDTGNVFEKSLPMPGAIDGINFLMRNHDVRILTYVHEDCRTGYEQKLNWLQHYIPALSRKNVCFASPDDKVCMDGDVLVEDAPDTIYRWKMKHLLREAYVVDQLYNRALSGVNHTRVKSVLEVAEKLGKTRVA